MRNKTFIIRAINAVLIIAMLAGYQIVIKYRKQMEENTFLQQKLKSYEKAGKERIEEEDDTTGYTDGTYTGEGNGFGGKIEVSVKITDGKLSSINILSAKQEDASYMSMAMEMVDQMVSKQTTEVDTVSGATFSSTGIKNAVIQALEKAVK